MAIGFNLPYANLAALYDYPDILRRPAHRNGGLAALTARAVAPRMVARRAEGGCARASLMAGLLPEVPFLLWQIVTALIPS
jgi:hypothetical protein